MKKVVKKISISVAILSVAAIFFSGCDKDNGKNSDIAIPDKADAVQTAYADEETTGKGFTFTAKDDWTASVKATTVKSSSVPWISLLLNGVETYSGSAGTITLVISIEPNFTGKARAATIEIVCGSDKISISVSQEGTTKDGEIPNANPTELTNAMINTGNATLVAGTYQVKSNLTLNDGNNLTISPGVTIRFDKDRHLAAKVNTKIVAKGTSSQPITFTSSLQSPAAGDWRGLYLSGGKDNEFDQCVFEYGASEQTAVDYAMLFLENATASITNCTFRNSKYSGITLRGADSRFLKFEGNTISNCGENENNAFPITVGGASANMICLGDMSNNNTVTTAKGIGVWSGTVNRNITIKSFVPYLIIQDQTINNAATVTIEPGATLKFETLRRIDVKDNAKIIAQGTQSNPITFTSAKPVGSKQPGDWNGIYCINSEGSDFKYCIFEYGSGVVSAVWYGMIYLDDCKASIMNCTFRNSRYTGVSVVGIKSGFTAFDYNTITDCGEIEADAFPITAWWGNTGFMNLTGMGANNTIESTKGIGVGKGTVNANTYVRKYLYTICDYITISQPSGAGATLTIEPGTKMMFNKNFRLDIGAGGKLVAEGTASNEIVFTGSAKDRGWWQGISFINNSALSGSVLNYCEVSYGGAGMGINNNGNISCGNIRSGVLTIKNCTITHSRSWGIYVRDAGSMSAYPTIENNNTYSNNGPDNNSNVGSVEIGNY